MIKWIYLQNRNRLIDIENKENPRDRGAWWAAIYGVAQSRTRLKRLSSSSSRHVINNMINITNTAVCYLWKFLED